MAKYALDIAWERAKRRRTLLEEHLDPRTRRRLAGLGVTQGWSVLEVGGEGGSIAQWLCRQVGAGGDVTSTDIDIRFLQEIHEHNFQAVSQDITTGDLPKEKFDLVHARWLLHHLPQPERVFERMIAALRPGGWLLLEEVDFFPVQTSVSPLYVDFMLALTSTVVAASGHDCLWARALPALVAERGLTGVGGEGDLAFLQGGSPMAEFFQLTGEQMCDKVISSGALPAERFDAGLAIASLILLATALHGLLGPITSAQEISAQSQSKTFQLFPNPKFLSCFAASPSKTPIATVKVTPGNLNDTLTLTVRYLKPNLSFDMFTVQNSSLNSDGTADTSFTNFGLAWYQSDVQANGSGSAHVTIHTILVDQIFGFDAGTSLAPTHTFHVGFWFNNPNDATACGFDASSPTPFNGEQDAGPLAMISVPDATTGPGPLCLHPDTENDTCSD